MMIASADYEFLSQFLVKNSGLSLGPGKEYLLEARLIPLAQSWGLSGIPELVVEVRRNPQMALAHGVVEAMTTNETLFFRDKTPFDELRDQLLPKLLESRQTIRRLRIWSAAASTGQEAYSLAMLLRDGFPQLDNWSIEIVGTDLSKAALARAEAGVYSQFEVQRGLPIQLLVKHFVQDAGGWKIKDELRRWVRFRPMNLMDSFHQLGQFDVIFCRNVLIYFENPVKKEILERMATILRPDGHLILGAAETVLGVTEKFDRLRNCKAAVYTPGSLATV
ncbi:MAG: chemotaxis protein CheR [Planctomycetales bacterium 12-60-4]|nr:MAG: chemotaxis protein CheR [Planctomycetales bacterium 12-60-4]